MGVRLATIAAFPRRSVALNLPEAAAEVCATTHMARQGRGRHAFAAAGAAAANVGIPGFPAGSSLGKVPDSENATVAFRAVSARWLERRSQHGPVTGRLRRDQGH